MELDENGARILQLIVSKMETSIPGHPDTYLTYKGIHEALGLPYLGGTYGQSLKKQGLDNLAHWTRDNGLPAVSGLIVQQENDEPGDGYFDFFKVTGNIYQWWESEVRKSKAFDWTPYVGEIEKADPIPVDMGAAGREEMEVSRIIRDSLLTRRVKRKNEYRCQICGERIALPKGFYAEVHHIKPLGMPHNGPDIEGNTICVCPNHHAMLDYGAIEIDLRDIRTGHKILAEYVNYHNTKIYKARQT